MALARHPLDGSSARPSIGWPTLRQQTIALVIVSLFSFPAYPASGVASAPDAASSYTAIIAEAAERFTIPEAWIRAVIDVESHGDPRAVSPKGALGLMQLMPKTFTALRLRYALGADPYLPHDNIMAGAAYLREMYDCFGASGFLAAYNAGPKRYQDHLSTGRPLPPETSAYVVQLKLRLASSLPDDTPMDDVQDARWQDSALFAAHLKPAPKDGATVFVSASPLRVDHKEPAASGSLLPARGELFISLSSKKSAP